MLSNLLKKTVSKFYSEYIEFVYRTSKIIDLSDLHLHKTFETEKYVFTFWHGDSYCFYPLMKSKKLFVFTTTDKRGDYICNVAKHFGYTPVRLPNDSRGGEIFFKIKRQISFNEDHHIAMTLDGPLGPYHDVKEFPLIMALVTKRKILPVSIEVKYKIKLFNRWDKYVVPLPFNRISLVFTTPIEVFKDDRKENFIEKRQKIKDVLETRIVEKDETLIKKYQY